MFVRKELIVDRPPPGSGASIFRNFSLPQWAVIIILDFAFRLTILIQVPHIQYFVLHLWALHLGLLIPITVLVSLFRLRPIAALFAILVTTNILYLGTVVFSLVRINAENWMGNCSRAPSGTGCEQWVNGITWSYVVEKTMHVLPLVVINVLPFLAVFIYSRWRSKNKETAAS
jgi:hypothetical protein